MNYTIYIRKDNWESFKDEENKSEVINGLLESHYRKGRVGATHIERSPKEPKVIKTKEDAVQATTTWDLSLCKHDAVKGLCKKGCK